MSHSAEDLVSVFGSLAESFGDRPVVDADGNLVTFVDYDSIEKRFVVETEADR